jgi:hypothetical protein
VSDDQAEQASAADWARHRCLRDQSRSQPRIDGVLDDGRRVWLNFAPETNYPGVIARLGGHEAVVAERMRSLAQTLLAAADRLETGRQ